MSAFEELGKYAPLPFGEAVSLPFSAYRDSALFDEEMPRIFTNDWVFACAAGMVLFGRFQHLSASRHAVTRRWLWAY